MDIAAISQAVALMAATGAVSGLGESAALDLVARIRSRVRAAFGGDGRSLDALDRAIEDSADEGRLRELAAALTWYAQHDERFAEDLASWAEQHQPAGSVVQNVRAARDAYAAGRDMTVNQRPETK